MIKKISISVFLLFSPLLRAQITAVQSVSGTPVTGQAAVFDGTKFAFSTVGPGTVTNIATGTGLSGGPITSTGTISLSTPVAVANGGTGTGSTLTGLVRGGSPLTASELSGDVTTSGSNAATVAKVTGTLSGYNSVTKDASNNGVGFGGWHATLTGQTADITATNIIASATAGRYRASSYIAITTPGSVSSTLPNVFLICTDPVDSVAKAVLLSVTSATNTTATARGGSAICDAKAATPIQYNTSGYASSAAGMAFKIYIILEAM